MKTIVNMVILSSNKKSEHVIEDHVICKKLDIAILCLHEALAFTWFRHIKLWLCKHVTFEERTRMYG